MMPMHAKMPESMKHSKGGMCKACGGGECSYAQGGSVEEGPAEKANKHIKGVHKIMPMHESGKGVSHGYSEASWSSKPKPYHEQVLGEMRSMPNPKLKGLAEGGEVEGPMDADGDFDGDKDNDEMNGILGEELMSAIDSKDSKRVMECIESMILDCLSKD